LFLLFSFVKDTHTHTHTLSLSLSPLSSLSFEDTQAAMYLLRVSFSIVRATHASMTIPLEQWKEQAEAFDTSICTTVENILAVKMAESVRKQASLTSRLGQLRPTPHGDGDPSKLETGGSVEATRAERLPAIKYNRREQVQLGGSLEAWDEGLPPKKDTADVKLDA